MRWWVFGAIFSGGVCAAGQGFAQSVSIDDEKPAPPPEPAPAHKPAPAPPEPVVMPKVIQADVAYPDGAQGEHEVMLELTIATDGSVSDAKVTSGEAPFAEHAAEAARKFQFEPARRGERAIAAKIRFL